MSVVGATDCLQARVAAELSRRGTRWPQVAAAVLAARGRAGLAVESFARLIGVFAHDVVLLERGHCPPSAVPWTLVAVAPDLDWAGLGARWPFDARAGPTVRHPSAHREPARPP